MTAAVVDVPFCTINAYNYDRGFEFFYELGAQHHARHGHLLPSPRTSEADYACAHTVATAERALERLRERQPFLISACRSSSVGRRERTLGGIRAVVAPRLE